ncbi:hypothetical protein BD769DRAFT_1387503 [Suillus cothurnatus]|nr:hypothetical protein BD769DRAFT_1387503 [Suillus cothurnatus]
MSVALMEILDVFEGKSVFIFIDRSSGVPPAFHLVPASDIRESPSRPATPEPALSVLFVTRHVLDHPGLLYSTIRSIAQDRSVHTVCVEGMDIAELLAHDASLMCCCQCGPLSRSPSYDRPEIDSKFDEVDHDPPETCSNPRSQKLVDYVGYHDTKTGASVLSAFCLYTKYLSIPQIPSIVNGYMQHEDLWNMVCEALMMTDVMNMGRTCHAMRHLCDVLARRRLRQILEPWTGRHFQSFLDFLRDEGCIVTGSCALAMLMGGELSNARDLNLVGRPESFSVCDKFIQETMGYVTISEICHQALTRVVGRFRKYRRNEHIITLSLPKEGLHILHVILYAPSTIDMIYMTGGGLSTFYLELLLKGVTVHGHSAPHVPWGDKLGHVGHNDHNWTVA